MTLMRAVTTVGGLTLLSRLTGFLRDILTAAFMGAGPVADAFFVALKLPNFFRKITAEGAFSVAFVPMFNSEMEEKGKEEAMRFAEEAQAFMLAVMAPFSVVMILAMPWVIYAVAPGFAGEEVRYDLAVEMSRITFPYILMMSLAAMMGGVLNSFDRFGPFAVAPVFFNLCLIAALVFATPVMQTPGHAMSWGVAFAGIVQLVWMIWWVRRTGLRLVLRMPRLTARVRKLLRLMGPGVVGAGVLQINLFIDLILASLLPAGSISFLYYADRLYQLPLSVIGIAIGTALLPMLARALSSGVREDSDRLFSDALEISLLLAVPAAAALIVIPEPVMNVLFERGAFTAEDTAGAAAALMAYAFGIPAFVAIKVLNTAFFAGKDTKTPVKFAIIGAVANTVLGVSLIWTFKHVGIAMATSLAAWLNVFLLHRAVKKAGAVSAAAGFARNVAKIAFSALVMVVVLYVLENHVLAAYWEGRFLVRCGALGVLVVAGAGVYFACVHMTGVFRMSRLKAVMTRA